MDIGAWIGLITGLGSVVITLVVVVLSLLMTIPMMLLPIAIVFFVFRSLAQGAAAERELIAKGLPAPATIVGVAQTGTYLNNNPQVVIALSFALPDGTMRTAQVRKFLSLVQIPQFQPGRIVEVRYDANDPNRVAIASL